MRSVQGASLSFPRRGTQFTMLQATRRRSISSCSPLRLTSRFGPGCAQPGRADGCSSQAPRGPIPFFNARTLILCLRLQAFCACTVVCVARLTVRPGWAQVNRAGREEHHRAPSTKCHNFHSRQLNQSVRYGLRARRSQRRPAYL